MTSNFTLLQKTLTEIAVDLGWLDEGERKRYHRFLSPDRRAEFLAGRCFVKQEIADRTGLEPHAVLIGLSTNGKPFCEALNSKFSHFNLAHTNGRFVLAMADSPVGVDIETKRDLSVKSLQPFLSQQELALLNELSGSHQQQKLIELFTLKEAFIKATDKRFGLNRISFDLLDGKWELATPTEKCSFQIQENKISIIAVCVVKS